MKLLKRKQIFALFITALAFIGVAVASQADTAGDAQALKKAAIARSRTLPVDESTGDTGRLAKQPFADSGPAEAIQSVKSDFVENATRRGLATKNNSAPGLAEVGFFTGSSQVATVAAHLGDLATALASKGFPPYSDVRFTAEQWQGVEVSGTTARALVLGYVSYLRSGSWSDSDTVQYEADLVFEDGRWKLVSYDSTHVED